MDRCTVLVRSAANKKTKKNKTNKKHQKATTTKKLKTKQDFKCVALTPTHTPGHTTRSMDSEKNAKTIR